MSNKTNKQTNKFLLKVIVFLSNMLPLNITFRLDDAFFTESFFETVQKFTQIEWV